MERVVDGFSVVEIIPHTFKPLAAIKRTREASKASETYICFANGCGKTFNDSWTLRKHTLTHREKSYVCPDCGKNFLDNSKLRRHFLVHTGEKPFKCHFCGKCFSLEFNLTTHLRIHTGEKPYACTYPGCIVKFTQQSNLLSHLKTQHVEEGEHRRREYKKREPSATQNPQYISNYQELGNQVPVLNPQFMLQQH